ncbi:carbon-nitrogen hydrolase family protein [Nocardioides alcanivorans]|uniref:carbon-nitrogen hydrolase family protein n=1 Tax=Nocardioides alcanivorans TaxID=2897352 RepID=UPI001F3D5665|nr:carbon-nitrogen hydrolase family protein [Nocardioides alcanivorans]
MRTSDDAPATLRVALAQLPAGLDPSDNRAAVTALADDPGLRGAELVVLPEAFARDFGKPTDDLAPHAEPTDGAFARAVTDLAGADRTVIAGMFEHNSDGPPFNTLLVRGRARADYRKIHLYDSFGYRESDRLSAGEWDPVTVALGGFTLGLMTCYDLRFPELARDLVDRGADVLVVPAAWVAGRTPQERALKVEHWRTLVRARAIENVCHVVAVGQPGPRYTGHSMVVGPDGQVVVEAGADRDVITADLRREQLHEAREANPSLANRRRRPR